MPADPNVYRRNYRRLSSRLLRVMLINIWIISRAAVEAGGKQLYDAWSSGAQNRRARWQTTNASCHGQTCASFLPLKHKSTTTETIQGHGTVWNKNSTSYTTVIHPHWHFVQRQADVKHVWAGKYSLKWKKMWIHAALPRSADWKLAMWNFYLPLLAVRIITGFICIFWTWFLWSYLCFNHTIYFLLLSLDLRNM